MMTYLYKNHWLVGMCIFLTTIFLAMEIDARGRGGGGGNVARSGPAAGGSMRGSRPSNRSSTTRPSSEKRDTRKDIGSDRREVKSDRVEHRQDIHSERREWAEDRYRGRRTARIVVGTTLTVASWNALTCNRTIVKVGNITYYSCDGAWYQPYYQGSSVTYVVVNAPAGY